MNETPIVVSAKPMNIVARLLYILLMAFAYHMVGMLLFLVTGIQFIICAFSGSPNANLATLGRGLGRYMQQIICFLTFASDAVPFPISPWPSD